MMFLIRKTIRKRGRKSILEKKKKKGKRKEKVNKHYEKKELAKKKSKNMLEEKHELEKQNYRLKWGYILVFLCFRQKKWFPINSRVHTTQTNRKSS